jgi:hypothetical protein
MYGNSKNIPVWSDNTVVYNLTSLIEYYPRLNLLVPSGIGYYDGYEFDVAYMNYIFGNNEVFTQFFQIVMNLYMGKDVYIITDDELWSENLVESLMKLIQQRYGYNCCRINSYEDYTNMKDGKFDPGWGLANLDADKERFSMIDAMINTQRYMYGDQYEY